MKKLNYLLLVVFLFVTGISTAQQINFSKKFLKSTSYANKAELAICKNNLKRAVQYYDSVFMYTNKPFVRDVFNDALCEKKLGNQTKADSLFRILYLENFRPSLLSRCFNATKYYKLKQKEDAKYAQIDKIATNIQRTDQTTDALRYDSPGDMKKFLDTVLGNAQRIMKLQQEAEKDSLNLFVHDSPKLWSTLAHFFQFWHTSMLDSQFFRRVPIESCVRNVNFKKYGFGEFLTKQAEKGNFDHYTLALLYSFLGENLGFNVIRQYNNYLVVYSPDLFDKKVLDEINSNRKKFGLESYEDYFIKVRYADSLLNEGQPFKPIKMDSIRNVYDRYNEGSNFILVGQYRMNMQFHSDKSAFNAFQNQMKAIKQNNSQ